MSNLLFCVPIKPNKTDDFKNFIKNCLSGSKEKDYRDLLLRYEINTLKMWTHTIAGKNYALFTHDMSENAEKLLEGWTRSENPFDQWFKLQLEDCYDIESMDHMPPQPVFFAEIDARKQ